MRPRTAFAALSSVAVALVCVLTISLEQRALPVQLALVAAQPLRTRVAVRVAVLPGGTEARVRWLERDGTFWASRRDVAVRRAGVERTVCVGTNAGECALTDLEPCTQYEVAVWSSDSIGAQKGRRWVAFATPAAGDEELLCNGKFSTLSARDAARALHWQPFAAPYTLARSPSSPRSSRVMVLGDEGGDAAGRAVRKYGASQLVAMRAALDHVTLRLSLRYAVQGLPDDAAVPDSDAAVLIDVFFADGSATRGMPAMLLQRRNTASHVQRAVLALPHRAGVAVRALRVALVFGCVSGVLSVHEISLARVEPDAPVDVTVAHAAPVPTAPPMTVRTLLSTRSVSSATTRALVFVTQLTADHLPALAAAVRAWDGPVSAAVWVMGPEDVAAVAALRDSSALVRDCVDFHLVERPGASRYAHAMINLYPVNMLRNVALTRSRARYVCELDVDFVPSPRARLELEELAVAHLSVRGRMALVVPAFETTLPDEPLPRNKAEVVALVDAAFVRPLHAAKAYDAHAATDYHRWYQVRRACVCCFEWNVSVTCAFSF